MGRQGLLRRGIERARVTEDPGHAFTTAIPVVLPSYAECTASGCGYDPVTKAGRNIACTVCGGTGRVRTLATSYIQGRIVQLRRPDREFRIVATGTVADLAIATSQAARAVLDKALTTDGAYALVGGKKVRVKEVLEVAVEGPSSLLALCEYVREE
ncbi:MAG: hypothetical protein ACUVS5_11540 [Anaerolineae bacterium]